MKKVIAILAAVVFMVFGVTAFADGAETTPKYVFLFIGDGMGSVQIEAAQYLLGFIENLDASIQTPEELSFTSWSNTGMMTTDNIEGSTTDSAAAVTAMASGNKTLSGAINYKVVQKEDGTKELTTPAKLITEYMKETGWKVGVITSVSLNHATPAGFYAKSKSRYDDYYDIGVQAFTGTTLDFLGGGSLHSMNPADQTGLLELAAFNGWTIVNTKEDILKLNAGSGRVLAINPDIAEDRAMAYEIDRERRMREGEDILSLADMVNAGIRVLDNEDGFFLMTEGGKIDWACHANDAATSIYDTLALSDAVQIALDFAAQHPNETLIVVTADHETGGMTIGTDSGADQTHLGYLANQLVSFEVFSDIVADMRANGATLEDALTIIESNYGLTTIPGNDLSLSDFELDSLRTAFTISMMPENERNLNDDQENLYGGYEPMVMAVTQILDHKAGVYFSTYGHTGQLIPVYAWGTNAGLFNGTFDNINIFYKLMDAMDIVASE
jgi:alkaline phosphatase